MLYKSSVFRKFQEKIPTQFLIGEVDGEDHLYTQHFMFQRNSGPPVLSQAFFFSL